MFLLPTWGDKSPTGNRSRGHHGRRTPGSSLSSSFSLSCYCPKLIVDGRFRVVTGRKQPQSAVTPDSGRSRYRSAGEPIRTAWYCKP
ncbi:hypothetical protein BHM03_00027069 [Ensete ventricosum]|nr:hypothetical protein BHM03_00027069 [Ensete ventricosum]